MKHTNLPHWRNPLTSSEPGKESFFDQWVRRTAKIESWRKVLVSSLLFFYGLFHRRHWFSASPARLDCAAPKCGFCDWKEGCCRWESLIRETTAELSKSYKNGRMGSFASFASWDSANLNLKHDRQLQWPPHINRADRKSQVRQCLCFCTADFCISFAYKSAEQKRKHCLTWDFLSAPHIKQGFLSPACGETDMHSRQTQSRGTRTRERQALKRRFCVNNRVRKLNLGWCFMASKVAFSWPSVNRFGKNIWGHMTLGQVKIVPNFCQFGPQGAEKHNFWKKKNANPNYITGLCTLYKTKHNSHNEWRESCGDRNRKPPPLPSPPRTPGKLANLNKIRGSMLNGRVTRNSIRSKHYSVLE